MDPALVQLLRASFNYRAAQTLRSCNARNLKTRADLIEFATHIGNKFERSDWLYTAYRLDNKKLREFLVFADWIERQLHVEHKFSYEQKLPGDSLYQYLGCEPRTYTSVETQWIVALNACSMIGSSETALRPEYRFSLVADVDNSRFGGPERMLVATFLEPDALIDATWLNAVRESAAIAQIAKRVRWIGATIWLRVVDGFLQVQLPYQP